MNQAPRCAAIYDEFMRPDPSYIGPAWITAGEHRGRLALIDCCDEPEGATAVVLELDGDLIVQSEYLVIPLDTLEVPPTDERVALEERIWRGLVTINHGTRRRAGEGGG